MSPNGLLSPRRLATAFLLRACARLLLAAPLVLIVPSHSFAQVPVSDYGYIQRGVGPAEAFGAIFDLGPNYGRFTGSFQSVQDGGAPGFKMLGTNGLQPGSESWYKALRDMQHYAQSGDACQTYSQAHPTKVVPRGNDISDSYSKPGRGFVITYRSQAELRGAAYVGNLNAKEIAIINPLAKAWGISPAPSSIGDDGTPQYPEGATSVFGPDHPLYKTAKAAPCSKSPGLGTRVLSSLSSITARQNVRQMGVGLRSMGVGGAKVGVATAASALPHATRAYIRDYAPNSGAGKLIQAEDDFAARADTRFRTGIDPVTGENVGKGRLIDGLIRHDLRRFGP